MNLIEVQYPLFTPGGEVFQVPKGTLANTMRSIVSEMTGSQTRAKMKIVTRINPTTSKHEVTVFLSRNGGPPVPIATIRSDADIPSIDLAAWLELVAKGEIVGVSDYVPTI